jgi:FkbM family methyltransferase
MVVAFCPRCVLRHEVAEVGAGVSMNKMAELIARLKRLSRASILPRGAGHNGGIQQLIVKGTKLRFAALEGDTGDQIHQGYEEEVYEYILKIPRGAVFFDLGASIGNFSLFSAAHGLKTYAFEPDPKNFEALELNRRANDFAELRTFEIAISDGANPRGILMSNSKKQRRGDHHKVLRVLENSAHSSVVGQLDTEHTVRTLSLDQAIEQLNLPVPDYMKIDIDGSEVAFFKGAAKTLANPKLKGLMIELYKQSPFYPRLLRTLGDANFELEAEFQITSAGQIDAGLFNMEYVRKQR